MINIRDLEIKIVDGLQAELSKGRECLVIRANQTAPIPPYPYVSYTIMTPAAAGHGTWGRYDDGKDRKPVTQTWSFTVQSDDSTDSMTLAVMARDWLEHAGTVFLNDREVIVQSVGDIGSRDNLLTVAYEYRNGFDAVFWLLNEAEDTAGKTGAIETVELAGGW